MFGGCWWLSSCKRGECLVAAGGCPQGQVHPTRSSGIRTVSVSVTYCCHYFVVNRRKALLANRLALCYDS